LTARQGRAQMPGYAAPRAGSAWRSATACVQLGDSQISI
jgi:hypothetical protein